MRLMFFFPKSFLKKKYTIQNEISHFFKRKRMRQKCLIFFIFQILKGMLCNMQCKMRLIFFILYNIFIIITF